MDNNKVFVVHGRNEELRKSMFDFLRSIGLNPIEWDEAKRITGKPTPHIGEILDAVFTTAQAVIIMMTPDDEAKLRDRFVKKSDPVFEKELTPQPRPNVIYEAGMAMGRCPERTVILEFGENLRRYSDIDGYNVIRMNTDTPQNRSSLISALIATNITIPDLSGKKDWMDAGNFNLD